MYCPECMSEWDPEGVGACGKCYQGQIDLVNNGLTQERGLQGHITRLTKRIEELEQQHRGQEEMAREMREGWDNTIKVGQDIQAKLKATTAVVGWARELLEVARLRGDNELPHPSNDDTLWTARMQTAWDELGAALDKEE